MSNNLKNFTQFLNEASLRGNKGIPGEEPEGQRRESWFRKTDISSNAAARQYAMQNQQDIQNFMNLIGQSAQIQRGKEKELADLAVEVFREVFGYILDGVDLDFKIITGNEANQMMQATPTESEPMDMPELEELEEKGVISEIEKRKILRTIQQGKGLNTKEILNLSIFKDGIIDILGEEAAAEYLALMNRISNVMQFFDWSIPIEAKKQMWRARQGAAGSCNIDIQKEETDDDKEDLAKKVLADLANGEDIVANQDAEDLVDGLTIKLTVLGLDLSVLVHEGVKAVYMLITQAALEMLDPETQEITIMNTDTLFDELEEIKYGRQMQADLFKIVNAHPEVEEKMANLLRYDYTDAEIASFQEKLQYLFLAELAQIPAEEMLELVNAILSDSPEAEDLCSPLIKRCLASLLKDETYRAHKAGAKRASANLPSREEPSSTEAPMSKAELQRAIDAALDAGDYIEVERLSRFLGESLKRGRKYRRLR
jgi:hypothetical protein